MFRLCIRSRLLQLDSRSHFNQLSQRSYVFRGKQRSVLSNSEIKTEATIFQLTKPFAFVVFIGGCSFTGAAIWQYEYLRSKILKKSEGYFNSEFYGKAGGLRYELNVWWNSLSPGKQLAACIIAINCGVFGLWHIASLRTAMTKWFLSSPSSGARCWSMLLSTFSHYSGIHLALNMYVLWSFSSAADRLFGREHFLAFYLTAGTLSSLASYVIKYFRRSHVPSLGASGALMAVIGAFCWSQPNAEIGIAFISDILPISFSALSAMKFLIVMDTLGVVFRWSFFDHAAHLGGILFGIWYAAAGHKIIWEKREILLQKWQLIRKSLFSKK